MLTTPLPEAAQFDPTIQTLACLHAADAALNDASRLIRCALLPGILDATPAASNLAGLPALLRGLNTTQLGIQTVVDALESVIEIQSPIPPLPPPQ